jgi:hypothetical protein
MRHREHQSPEGEDAVEALRRPPMTLGTAAAAGVRLIVWCKECRH